MKKEYLYILLIMLFLFSFEVVYAKRGCCSGKGGVAYCSKNGHYICKNGDPSPSCTCNGIDMTTYEEDKANGDLYYGDKESITDENNTFSFFDDNYINNKEKNSITDYVEPVAVVIVIAGVAYVIGKEAGKKKKI